MRVETFAMIGSNAVRDPEDLQALGPSENLLIAANGLVVKDNCFGGGTVTIAKSEDRAFLCEIDHIEITCNSVSSNADVKVRKDAMIRRDAVRDPMHF